MLTATLEQLLNRSLPRSQRAQQLVAELAGKSIALEVPALARVSVASNGVTLTLGPAQSCDATLSGGLLSLFALQGTTAQAVLQRGDVRIAGDAEVAQKFRELFRLLRPDPEEELALLVGDVPAHQLGRLARLGGAFARRAADTALANLGEYLGHERGDLVPRHEGEQFLRGVDALREDLDRLQARVELFARRRGAP
jgi:ubiquinone biosynthesis accessory factor UbiJ